MHWSRDNSCLLACVWDVEPAPAAAAFAKISTWLLRFQRALTHTAQATLGHPTNQPGNECPDPYIYSVDYPVTGSFQARKSGAMLLHVDLKSPAQCPWSASAQPFVGPRSASVSTICIDSPIPIKMVKQKIVDQPAFACVRFCKDPIPPDYQTHISMYRIMSIAIKNTLARFVHIYCLCLSIACVVS
jgi:hypothetical protein